MEPAKVLFPRLSKETRDFMGIPLEKYEGDRLLVRLVEEEARLEKLRREVERAERCFGTMSALLVGYGLGIFSAAAFAILIGG